MRSASPVSPAWAWESQSPRTRARRGLGSVERELESTRQEQLREQLRYVQNQRRHLRGIARGHREVLGRSPLPSPSPEPVSPAYTAANAARVRARYTWPPSDRR